MPRGDESTHAPRDAPGETPEPPPGRRDSPGHAPETPPDMPRSRRIPGDIGWRPEPDAAERAGVVEPGLALRLLSVVGFFVAGVTGVIATAGWALVFVVGLGKQPTLWGWAAGRPAGEVAPQVLLVVLLGLGCAGATLLAMWAAWRGLQPSAGRPFWAATQAVVGAVAVGMVLVDRRYPAALDAVGVGAWEWWLLFGVVALALVTAHLRMRRAEPGSRDPEPEGADAGDTHARRAG